MANRGVKGRVLDETGGGIEGLSVRAVDFDPFFNEDDVLKAGKTDADGRFSLAYSPDVYGTWKADREPDIVVQIFGPRTHVPDLFGTRLLYESREAEDVSDEIFDAGEITIHSGHIDGWLVTHATLDPTKAEAVALFPGNRITHLIDGAAMFPAVTDAAMGASSSVNLMTLFFDVGNHLITKFKSGFDPSNPPSSNCKSQMEATLEDELKKLAAQGGKRVNLMVADIPLSANDTATEVREFFKDTGVRTAAFTKGFAVLHAKAIVVDGKKAILMGSPLKQFYFSDQRHSIRDARHKGSLMHDVNIAIEGPAVRHIDRTFATVWKSTGQSPVTIDAGDIAELSGDDAASVQVLRTMPGHTFKSDLPSDEDLPHGETGILEAYERAIHNAERFIYFENQYFTSPEIIDALIARMKDPARSKLEIILVLNIRPDLPGYPDQQIQNVHRLKIAAEKHAHKLGVFTLWSRAEVTSPDGSKKFEIMPIYAHAKCAVIDDRWATVGSANLDGTSMNYHEIGLIATGAITDRLLAKIRLGDNFGKFLWDSFWYLFFFIFKEILFNLKAVLVILFIAYKLIFDFKETMETITEGLGDVLGIPGLVREAFTRTAPHALPNRSRQPSRSVEMNLVLFNGIAGQPESAVVHKLREQLWTEHLGFAALPAEMQSVPNSGPLNWVEAWNRRAEEFAEAIRKDQSIAATTPKILPWKPETTAEPYLAELKIRKGSLRNQAQRFEFKDCKVQGKDLLPWPII